MGERVVVIGGGAAGLLAAGSAALRGAQVILFEKTDELGKKLQIAGKGRCNLTNAGDREELIVGYAAGGPFLYSAFARFDNQALINLFQRLGVPTKVERGRRVFPVSDDARQVAKALKDWVEGLGVEVRLNQPVGSLVTDGGFTKKIAGCRVKDRVVPGGKVILCTGGCSYPGTGSTGDGYRMAKEIGHRITPLRAALVPLRSSTPWVKEVQGLALRNVTASLWADDKELSSEFGEMLFTHFGVSGPIILTMSRSALDYWQDRPGEPLTLVIDLKPALTPDKLDLRIQRDFGKYSRKQLINGLRDLLPKALIPVILSLTGLDPTKPVHQVTREERRALGRIIKRVPLAITGALPLAAAIVTAGGVNLKEVDPRTMESRLVKGLYLAGEVLDIDGYTGGYNLQAAFSTGWLAGHGAAE
ncbi:MAG: NAD(P)/FAD-dependent oxidoreductase [Limnochordia bacterium]|jgi:predicted Rossmann fold flavoprotein